MLAKRLLIWNEVVPLGLMINNLSCKLFVAAPSGGLAMTGTMGRIRKWVGSAIVKEIHCIC